MLRHGKGSQRRTSRLQQAWHYELRQCDEEKVQPFKLLAAIRKHCLTNKLKIWDKGSASSTAEQTEKELPPPVPHSFLVIPYHNHIYPMLRFPVLYQSNPFYIFHLYFSFFPIMRQWHYQHHIYQEIFLPSTNLTSWTSKLYHNLHTSLFVSIFMNIIYDIFIWCNCHTKACSFPF